MVFEIFIFRKCSCGQQLFIYDVDYAGLVLLLSTRLHLQQVHFNGWLQSKRVARNIHICLANARYTEIIYKIIFLFIEI